MRHPGPVSLRHRTPPRVDGVRRPTVLIGVDGSEASWSALAWACGETRRLDGRAIAVHVSPSTAKSLSVGAGVGIRYNLGFAPLRLDLGFPLNRREGDAPFQVYVSIGQSF